jgi:hypothetical protein
MLPALLYPIQPLDNAVTRPGSKTSYEKSLQRSPQRSSLRAHRQACLDVAEQEKDHDCESDRDEEGDEDSVFDEVWYHGEEAACGRSGTVSFLESWGAKRDGERKGIRTDEVGHAHCELFLVSPHFLRGFEGCFEQRGGKREAYS